MKCDSLGIPDPCLSEESAYNTFKASSRELVGSLLGVTALNYVGHSACVCGSSTGARKEWKYTETAELARQKYLTGVQERNRIHRSTSNGSWIISIPHRLNSADISQEKFRDNLHLRYGLMPQDIPLIMVSWCID